MRRREDVRKLVLFFVSVGVGVGVGGVSFTYDRVTSQYLCASQCMTFSSDSPVSIVSNSKKSKRVIIFLFEIKSYFEFNE